MSKAARGEEGKKLRLTVFLVKDQYKNIEDFVEIGQLRRIPVNSADAVGTLFFKSGISSTPPWAAIFASVDGFNPRSIVNRHSQGLYVLQEKGRWFVFTFGYTRHLLNQAALERNFGLIVSLNLGDPDAIKAIDKMNISHIGLQSREQAGRDIAFDGFEFDTDIDLLKAITAKGPQKSDDEQETYSGRDSFSVYTRITLGTFADLARRFYRASQSTAYKQRYPWVGKVDQVRDPTIISSLEKNLVDSINTADCGKIWMAVPEIVVWEEVENFAYKIPSGRRRRAGPTLYPDVDLEGWLAETKLRGELTVGHLSSRKVFQCYKDGRAPASWSVYRCLNAEIDIGEEKYILNDGDWYSVETDYVRKIDGFYRSVPDSALSLPNYRALTEPDYLIGVASKHTQYALMDRKNIKIGGGKSTVEFCDLYSKGRDIIHVKQYGGSSLLSHLFNQAKVSAECFINEIEFRRDVNKSLPTGFKLKDPDAEPNPQDYTVCIAIMSKVSGPLEIPFFSKVSLKHAVKSLQRMGFRVTKLKVER